jgi:hypothetical protein
MPAQRTGSRTGGVGERQFPERIDVSDPVMKGIGLAAQAPAYIYERPLAVANQLTGGAIDQASDTVMSTPVLGDIARGIGNVFDASSKLFAGGNNATFAQALRATAGMPDNAPLDPIWHGELKGFEDRISTMLTFGVLEPFNQKPWTVGDLRRKADERGFTRQDTTDLASGKKGLWDFGDKQVSPNPLVDLGTRMVLDPINATVIAGAGVSALSKLSGVDKLLNLSQARAIVAGIPALANPARGVTAGVAALRTGVTEGITHRSLGVFLMGMGRGGSALLSSYRKAAIGTTLAQVGVNAVDDALADKSGVPGPINDLFVLGRAIAEDRPLSEGMLFNLWAVTHFPLRDMAGSVRDAAKGKVRYWWKTGDDIEARMVDLLEKGGSYAQRRARMFERFGGADGWLDFVAMVGVKTREGRIAAAFSERPLVRSMAETQEHARMMNQMAMDEVRLDPISGRDAVDAAIDWATGARRVGDFEGGLRTTFSPDRLYDQWNAWRGVAAQTSAIGQGAAVPKLQEVLIREHVQVARERFRRAAVDGMVPAEEATRIILDNPALMVHETGGMWARMMVRGADSVDIKWIEQRLKSAEDDALTLKSVLAPAAQWENRAAREAAHRAGLVRSDGTLDFDRMPTEGMVETLVPTANDLGRRNAGFPATTLDDVAAMRSDPVIADIADPEALRVFDESGYGVEMVKAGVAGENGALAPALISHLDPKMSPQGAAEYVALQLQRANSRGHGRIIYRGNAITNHGLSANAVEFKWDVGPGDAGQVRAATDVLNRLFDESYVDDTAGVYRIIIPESQAERLLPRIVNASQEMGGIFPAKAVGGIFEGNHQRVWTETIRNTAQRNRRGRTARATGAERSIADVERDAHLSTNWHAARQGFAERDQRMVQQLAAQPGPDSGPVRQATPEGGLGVGTGGAGRGVGVDEAVQRVRNRFRPPAEDAPVWSKARERLDENGWATDPAASGTVVERAPGQYVSYDAQGVANGYLHFRTAQESVFPGVMQVVVSGERQGIATRLYDAAYRDHGFGFMDTIGRTGMSDSGAAFASRWLERQRPTAQPLPVPDGLNPEGVRWLQDRDAEAAAFVPNYDASLTQRFTAEELAPFAELQQELTRYNPTYTLSSTPKGGTPYQIGQGKAYQDLAMVRQTAGDAWTYKVGSKAANFWHTLFGRVYTKRLQDDGKQELFSDLIGEYGATPKESNHFLRALAEVADQPSHFPNDVRIYQRLDMLPPGLIDKIAHKGGVAGFDGFSADVLAKMGKNGASNAIRRSSSRFYRSLEKTHRAKSGEGTLGSLIDYTYGAAEKAMDGPIGKGTGLIRAWYPLFRFVSDLRWHAMNAAESRIVGAVRYGQRQVAPDQITQRTTRAMERVPTNPLDIKVVQGGGPLDDAMASGWLDHRKLEGIIGPAFDAERVASTQKALTALAADDPVMQVMRRKHGDGATPEQMVDDLDRMMYDFDKQGVPKTITDEAKKLLDDADYEAMKPFIQQLTRQHEKIFRDVVHSFRGNTNRSNIERLANSYFLYWPISYQLKVGKVLFDTLTYRSFGRQTDLLGAWTVDRLTKEHAARLVDDEEYRQMFVDNPELWRAAGMFLPITPMDIGVSMSRFTRYTTSALGAHLNLFPEDPSYPDITTPEGIFEFSSRIMQMGPLYTADLLARAGRELGD